MRKLRPVMCLIGALALAAFIAACATADTEDASDESAPREAGPLLVPGPELDVETLQADLLGKTIGVERSWGETYVGAVDEDLFIAVSFPEEADAQQPQEAMVYLCDSVEIAEYLTGEVGDGTTTLEGEALAVELSLEDGAVSGMVTLDGGEPQPFTAEEATGDAGLYTAEGDLPRRYWPDEANGDGDVVGADAARSASDARIAGAAMIGPPRYSGGWIILN